MAGALRRAVPARWSGKRNVLYYLYALAENAERLKDLRPM
jgi:hypothetical protein